MSSRTVSARAGVATRLVALAVVSWCVVVLGIRFAEPIIDGDLFWHLEYAEQMLVRGTLVPDHTLYSWMPSSNAMIYCAWLAEFVLHGLHQLGELPLLFAFRYLCVAAAAALLLVHARSLGIGDRLPAWSIVLLSLLASVAGTIIKPEIFSFLFFHLVIFAYCRARAAGAAQGARNWFLAIPLIVLVWVNSHGGFILAAPFFVATVLGELLTRRFAPGRALPVASLRWLLAAWGLTGLAVFATPYGWRYPWQLVGDYLLRATARPDEAWNSAHQSILAPHGSVELLSYGILLALAAAGLGVIAGRRIARLDWGLLIACVAYGPLYLLYGRTTFYFAVLFGYAALQLYAITRADHAGLARSRRMIDGPVAALFALFVGVTALHAARGPANRGAWIGFGISHINPVAEAEFLAASRLGPRLYNLFDLGGYLLWRLHPTYSVMVDQRSFPYLDWFDEQRRFANGEIFDVFLKKYPADTAAVDLVRSGAWRNFLQSPDWRLAYYGPSAVVFVRRSIPDDRLARDIAPGRFDHLRNGLTALGVFDFAVVVGDYPTAWKVLAQIEDPLRRHVERVHLDRSLALRDGHRALAVGDFDRARELFVQASARPLQGWREPVILQLLEARAAAAARGDRAEVGRQEAALRELVLPKAQL